MSHGTVHVRSAGSHSEVLHPNAVRVPAERGVDISGRSTKHLRRFARMNFAHVITLCDGVREGGPEFEPPGARPLEHPIPPLERRIGRGHLWDPPHHRDLASEIVRLRGGAGVGVRNDVVTGPGGSQILLQDPSGDLIELFQPAGDLGYPEP